jgi:hypothetical protein
MHSCYTWSYPHLTAHLCLLNNFYAQRFHLSQVTQSLCFSLSLTSFFCFGQFSIVAYCCIQSCPPLVVHLWSQTFFHTKVFKTFRSSMCHWHLQLHGKVHALDMLLAKHVNMLAMTLWCVLGFERLIWRIHMLHCKKQ